MISIGGVVKNNETFTDPWANGLGIFDMTTLTWGSSYDAKAAPYAPSKPVVAYYNSSSRYPTAWASQDLKTIFNDDGATSVNTNKTNSPAPPGKKTNTGAIAGGVVGGLALIAVAGCVFFFCLKLGSKREKARLDKLSSSQQGFSHQSYGSYHDNSYKEMDAQQPKYQLGTETTRLAEMGGEHGGAHQPLMNPIELDAHR